MKNLFLLSTWAKLMVIYELSIFLITKEKVQEQRHSVVTGSFTKSIEKRRVHKLLINLSMYLLIAFSFCSCQSDDDKQADERAAFKEVQLICESLGEESAVYAILRDNKVKLAEIHNCNIIRPEQYENHDIPKDAIFAVGGKGVEHAEYVYAQLNKNDENELRFYINRIDQGIKTGIKTELATYKKGRFLLMRPLHLADLAGYYIHQGKDTSYVLFLGLKGPKLAAKLFATGEPLPAQKMLQRALPEFASTPDTDFYCELNTLVFHSSIGNGIMFWQPDSAAVVFNPFMDKHKEVIFELIAF